MRLTLLRHGESTGNAENRLQGQHDYELTELGRRQAIATAERLAAEGIDAIYSSPLLRAWTTAEAIGERLARPPIKLPEVAEYHFGELSGNTYADVRQIFAAAQGEAVRPPAERVYPGEEGRENFFNRVTQAIWALADKHAGASIVIVSHGGPIALFCQAVLGLPYRRPMPFGVDNCSMTVFNVRDEAPTDGRPRAVLVHLNDTCHLRNLSASDDESLSM